MKKAIVACILISLFNTTLCMENPDKPSNESEKKQIDVIRSTAVALRKRSSGELIKKKTINQLEPAAAQKAKAHNQKILSQQQAEQNIKK
jgi:hypothetical protein